MFENAELGHKIDKATIKEESPRLRAALLEAQRELAKANFSVIVIVSGVSGGGEAGGGNGLAEGLHARGGGGEVGGGELAARVARRAGDRDPCDAGADRRGAAAAADVAVLASDPAE